MATSLTNAERERGSGGLDPGAITTRAELGALLSAIRRRSGRSLRDLAATVGSSASTLSGWCRAENLPFPAQDATFRAMLVELGIDQPSLLMDALVRVRESAGGTGKDAPPPYPGLKSFGRQDADRFFGRETLTARAHRRLQEVLDDQDRPNVLLVVGASGSGKSSLLHAGLAPRLGDDGFVVTTMTPGPSPMSRLDAMMRFGTSANSQETSQPQVTIIDQGEELFTTSDEHEATTFLTSVIEWTTPPVDPTRAVIIALRIDFYSDLVASGHLTQAVEASQILVGPMGADEVRRAIVEPARRAGVAVDDDLVELLVRDFLPSDSLKASHDVGALPLLSHTLLETWTRSRRGRMTVADYHATGGLTGAINRSAELAFQRSDPEDSDLLRQVFLRMVHMGDGDVVARASVGFDDVSGLIEVTADASAAGARDQVRHLLDAFIEARLVTVHEDAVEISHEALLTAWPRLRAWIDEDRDALRLQRRIADAAKLWADNDRDPALLPRGVMLDAMSETATRGVSVRLTPLEREYVEAGVTHDEQERLAEARRAHRLRWLTTVAVGFGVLAGLLAVVAVFARSDALQARDDALSRQVALSTDRLAENDPSLAAQFAVVGYDIAPTPEARAALLDAAISSRASRLLGGPGTSVVVSDAGGGLVAVSNAADASVQLASSGTDGLERIASVPLSSDEAESYALALSPDATMLAVGDTTASIVLWDVSNPTEPVRATDPLAGPDGPIQGLAFSPDGSELAAVGLGDGAFRWATTDPSSPTPLPLLPAEDITWSVGYHPSDDLLAVGDDVGLITLWDITDSPPRQVSTLHADERAILDLHISDDGTRLAAGSRGGTTFLWDISTPASPVDLHLAESSFDSWVNAVAFAPEADLLAAGSSDGELRLWDLASMEPLQTLRHPAAVTGLAFAAQGRSLISSATDGTARRWDLDRAVLPQVTGRVWTVEFDGSGSTLAAFSGEETRRWDVTDPTTLTSIGSGLPSPNEGPSFSGAGALSPAGDLYAHGTFSGEVLVYDATEPENPASEPWILGGSDELVEAVAFSPDRTLLAAGGVDTAVRIWRVDQLADPNPIAVLDAPTEIVLNLTWSPSGRYLAAPSADNHVYVFDLTDPDDITSLAPLGGLDSEAYAAAFTPDERFIATAGSDATVLLWDLTDPATPEQVGGPVTGPSGRIFDLDIAATGAYLAASVVDGRAWVWRIDDITAPEVHAVLGTGSSPLYALSFNHSGDVLAASGADGRVRVWRLDEAEAKASICETAGDPITEAEWTPHVAGRSLDPPCHRSTG